MPASETTTNGSSYYLWEISGRPVAVKLSYAVVDRLLQEVMRGFGAMPRRGVEMGGLLLGSVDRSGPKPVVVVEDYEPVPCQHTRGATYLLSDQEAARFRETVAKWAPEPGRQTCAVGYYRSHTREGLGMADEDLEVFNEMLPDPAAICLLVKPFATRVSQAGIFIRENGGVRAQSSYQEFPFRRRELGGGEPASPSSSAEDSPHHPRSVPTVSAAAAAAAAEAGHPHYTTGAAAADASSPFQSRRSTTSDMATSSMSMPSITSDDLKLGIPTSAPDPKTGSKIKSGWVWIPLSFIFMLFGTIVGFMAAISVRNQLPASIRPDPYSLHLTVTPAGDSLHVRWDRDAAPIHNQAKGALIISDAGAQKTVTLDADQLRNGSVVYKRASNDVRFRLEVQTGDRVAVAETMDFRVESPAR